MGGKTKGKVEIIIRAGLNFERVRDNHQINGIENSSRIDVEIRASFNVSEIAPQSILLGTELYILYFFVEYP